MALQTIKKEVTINASRETVWDVLTKDEHTRNWYAAFSEGSHAKTDWKEGSKAIFSDDSGCGLIARIVESQPPATIAMEFEGVLTGSREDFEGPVAQALKGGKEIYRLTGQNGTTQLAISADMDEKYLGAMAGAWDHALAKIKALAEKL